MPDEKEPCEFGTDCGEEVTSYGKVELDGSYTKPPILGYRNMTADEKALFDEGKALAETVGDFIARLEIMPVTLDEKHPTPDAINRRWLRLGKDDLQTGFMLVLRSIAKPTTF